MPKPDPDSLPERGVGLLFQCCQANLREQFEYLQRLSNNQDPPRTGGPDPLIGQSAQGGFPALAFSKGYNKPKLGRGQFAFHSFVKLKGGKYFFVPFISFFKSLR